MLTVIYKSAKGDHFLTWDQWMNINATEQELAIYRDDAMTPEKLELYKRWVADEQIVEHKHMHEDGSEEIFIL